MMPAAKHGDPQLGVDIHLCVVPPSPSPVPLPTPHMSVVFDPMDYLPFIGATVTVCGMKRAVAGTSGTAVHIPPGFPFAPKLPDKDDEIFMGSATVVADGDPFSFLGVPVLACQVVGMPSPPRPRRKGGPRMMLLPTVFNLAIPTNVFVGGPPTISLMGMAFKLGFAGLGRLARSRFGKAIGARFKKFRQKLFKNMEPGFLKCKVLRAEPVNILTGEVVVEQVDFTLSGRIPVEWRRVYNSGNPRRGACGIGWESPADARLEFDRKDGTVAFTHPNDGPALFPARPERFGESEAVLELMDGARLSEHDDEFRVLTPSDLVYHFPKSLLAEGEDGVLEYRLGEVTDLCGNWLRYEWSGAQLLAIRESSGRRLVLEHRAGKVCELRLAAPDAGPAHAFVRYEYDATGCLVCVRDALNQPYTFAYDGHYLVRHTNRCGLSFHYEYEPGDAERRVVHAWGQDGLYDYRFRYLPSIRETRITDSLGHSTTVQCNEHGLPILETDPLGGQTIFEYDEAGRTTAIVDADGNRTEYAYDESGNPTALVRPDGSAFLSEVDARNKPVRITSPNGAIWQQTWDDRGLLVRQTAPLGGVTSYKYDAAGSLRAVTNAAGATTSFAYDGNGHLEAVTDALGGVTRVQCDALGQVLARTDPLGRTTRYLYDAKGRLIEATLPDGSTVRCRYDAQDRLTHHEGEGGALTRFEYFGQGLVSKRHQPDGGIVEYHYDTEEQLVGVTNERGESFRLKRDAIGRVVEENDYWGQVTRYDFSPAGHLRRSCDPLGRVMTFATDPLGRIRRKVTTDARDGRTSEETFDFDAAGNLTGCANEHVKVQRRYDPEGRLLEERQGEFILRNAFDLLGRRIRRETSAGNTVVYGYDLLARVTSIQINDNLPILVERDTAGQVSRETLGPQLDRHFEYDAAGRLMSQGLRRAGEWVFVTRFGYDAAGNLTQRSDGPHGVDTFRYDTMQRVVEHQDARGRLKHFLHDPAGDLLSTRVTGDRVQPSAGGHDANGIWAREGWHEGTCYRFDRVGNLVQRLHGDTSAEHEGEAFDWDSNRRLVRSRGKGIETAYAYDPLGRRIFKQTGTKRTWFGWDGDMLAHDTPVDGPDALRESTQAPCSREFVYYPGTFVPLAMVRREVDEASQTGHVQTYHYHTDPNGSPTRLTDAAGDVTWFARYDAAGRAEQVFGNVENPIRLQGQYEDRETGLHYNRHRYYDSILGCYISQDPTRTFGGINLYAYGPNPFGWIDPLGLEVEWVDPNTLNFSQAYVTKETETYEALMKKNEWDWNRFPEDHPNSSALKVMEVDGQLVSLDNRRLLAAQNAELPKVPIVKVDPNAIKPGTNITWKESLEKRLNSKPKGTDLPKIQLPPTGTRNKPKVVLC
jgi:RHS repeat-associated protein